MLSASRENPVPALPTASALRRATEQRRLGRALEMGAPRPPQAVPALDHLTIFTNEVNFIFESAPISSPARCRHQHTLGASRNRCEGRGGRRVPAVSPQSPPGASRRRTAPAGPERLRLSGALPAGPAPGTGPPSAARLPPGRLPPASPRAPRPGHSRRGPAAPSRGAAASGHRPRDGPGRSSGRCGPATNSPADSPPLLSPIAALLARP